MGEKQIVPRRQPQFDLSGGAVCLNFVNTLDNRPSADPEELLNSYADLVAFGEESGILHEKQAEHFSKSRCGAPEAQRSLARAIELREALYVIFSAVLKKTAAPAKGLETLNSFLRTAGDRSLLLEKKGRFSWTFADHFSYDAVLWPIARSAADLLISGELPFVRTCSSKTCQWFFLDTSKNHRRRWCNMKLCGNRAKVRRFYERQKKGDQ
jgi:predicted RNA-binding Zn ribbon-like protein